MNSQITLLARGGKWGFPSGGLALPLEHRAEGESREPEAHVGEERPPAEAGELRAVCKAGIDGHGHHLTAA
jgi:hypothetical protein